MVDEIVNFLAHAKDLMLNCIRSNGFGLML